MWLWHMDPRVGKALDDGDWGIAVARRLGSAITGEGPACAVCGQEMDAYGVHAECCALPTATKGHYAVVNAVVEGMKLADSAIQTEARGLI